MGLEGKLSARDYFDIKVLVVELIKEILALARIITTSSVTTEAPP